MSQETGPDPGAMSEALLDELSLDLEALCRYAGVEARWVEQRVTEGVLVCVVPGPLETWRFDALALQRVRRLALLERDFEAVPELAALVVDLEDEVRALRARLRRLEGAGRP